MTVKCIVGGRVDHVAAPQITCLTSRSLAVFRAAMTYQPAIAIIGIMAARGGTAGMAVARPNRFRSKPPPVLREEDVGWLAFEVA
jgi:hypothetical protein